MNSVSEEAEDGSEPEQESEPSKQILAEFDPLWSLGRRSESVWTISLLRRQLVETSVSSMYSDYLIGLNLGVGQPGVEVSPQSLAELSHRDLVEVDVELLLQLVEVLLLGLA